MTADQLARNFGVSLPAGTPPDTLLAVHPTQLYEAVLMIGVFMVLWRLRNRGHATGWLFSIYLMLAGAERFLIEFVRAKEDRIGNAITVAQVVAIGLMATGAVLYTRWKAGEPMPPGEYLEKAKK